MPGAGGYGPLVRKHTIEPPSGLMDVCP